MVINSAKLRIVFCHYEFQNVKFIHNQSIERLEIEFDDSNGDEDRIFENVNYFQINNCITLSPKFLNCLPNVKKIQCYQNCGYQDGEDFLIEQIMNCMIKRRELNEENNLEIYFNNNQLIDNFHLSSCAFYD